jgi:hypothetical protein
MLTRAITECATAEEVLELQKEYVDFDKSLKES